ncbi:MAG: MerR family transcriptional regulator, partial [Clostridia bacterium]|nr:MerR family transcriptional regulator [Clostridia bacterium]
KLEKLEELQKAVADAKHFTVESIGDIAITVTNKKKLNRMYLMAFLLGLPLVALQIAGVLLWALEGIWWVFVLWAALAIPFAIFFSRYYYRHVAYVCPECHTVFRPTFKEMFFASHTPKTRRLTCTSCGHKGFCVEVWGGDEA